MFSTHNALPPERAELCLVSSRLLLSGTALATGSHPTAEQPSFPFPHPVLSFPDIYRSQTFFTTLSCSAGQKAQKQRLWPTLCTKLGWRMGASHKKMGAGVEVWSSEHGNDSGFLDAKR